MLRGTLLYLAKQDSIRRFVTHNRLARRSARRFVAGETLDEALQATRALNQRGLSVSLDHLGENVNDAAEACSAANDYIQILDAIKQASLDANISIKLTALGLDIEAALCEENVRRVLDRAKSYNIFVRVDMEGAAYTARTLDPVASGEGRIQRAARDCLPAQSRCRSQLRAIDAPTAGARQLSRYRHARPAHDSGSQNVCRRQR